MINYNNNGAGILTSKLSDMIFLCRYTNIRKTKGKKYIEYERYDINKIEDFTHSLVNSSIYKKILNTLF